MAARRPASRRSPAGHWLRRNAGYDSIARRPHVCPRLSDDSSLIGEYSYSPISPCELYVPNLGFRPAVILRMRNIANWHGAASVLRSAGHWGRGGSLATRAGVSAAFRNSCGRGCRCRHIRRARRDFTRIPRPARQPQRRRHLGYQQLAGGGRTVHQADRPADRPGVRDERGAGHGRVAERPGRRRL